MVWQPRWHPHPRSNRLRWFAAQPGCQTPFGNHRIFRQFQHELRPAFPRHDHRTDHRQLLVLARWRRHGRTLALIGRSQVQQAPHRHGYQWHLPRLGKKYRQSHPASHLNTGPVLFHRGASQTIFRHRPCLGRLEPQFHQLGPVNKWFFRHSEQHCVWVECLARHRW